MAAEKSKLCARAIDLIPPTSMSALSDGKPITKLAVLAVRRRTFADVDRRRGNPFE
jgi:hypothetical protein